MIYPLFEDAIALLIKGSMKIRYIIISMVLFFLNVSVLFAMEQPSALVQETDKDAEQTITVICKDGSIPVPVYFLELSKTYVDAISDLEFESLDFFNCPDFQVKDIELFIPLCNALKDTDQGGLKALFFKHDAKTLLRMLKVIDYLHMPLLMDMLIEPLAGVLKSAKALSLFEENEKYDEESLLDLPAEKKLARMLIDSNSLLDLPAEKKLARVLVENNSFARAILKEITFSSTVLSGKDYESTMLTRWIDDDCMGFVGDTAMVIKNVQTDEIVEVVDYDSDAVSLLWNDKGDAVSLKLDGPSIYLIDAKTKEVIEELPHTDTVEQVAWSPNGDCIASILPDRTVVVWHIDSTNFKGIGSGVSLKHDKKVNFISWSPDSQYIASGTGDTTLYVWDLQEGYTNFKIDKSVSIMM